MGIEDRDYYRERRRSSQAKKVKPLPQRKPLMKNPENIRHRFDDWREYNDTNTDDSVLVRVYSCEFCHHNVPIGEDCACPMPEPTTRPRWRWQIPGWAWVVGTWLAAFWLFGRWTHTENMTSAYESEANAIAVGLAGVVATLVWAGQRRRDAWRCVKAIVAGLALAGVSYWIIMLTASERY